MLGDLIRTVEPAASLRDRSRRLRGRGLAPPPQSIDKLPDFMTVAFGFPVPLFRDFLEQLDFLTGFIHFSRTPVNLREPVMSFVRERRSFNCLLERRD